MYIFFIQASLKTSNSMCSYNAETARSVFSSFIDFGPAPKIEPVSLNRTFSFDIIPLYTVLTQIKYNFKYLFFMGKFVFTTYCV